MVRSDGAQNFASAHKSEMRENDEGKKSIHIRHIHLAGDRNPNTKERDNGTIQYFVRSCRGLKRVDTAYIALYQIHFLNRPPPLGRGHDAPGGRGDIVQGPRQVARPDQ